MSIGSQNLTVVNPEFERLRLQTNPGQAGWARGPETCGDFCVHFVFAKGRKGKCALVRGAAFPASSMTCDRKMPR